MKYIYLFQGNLLFILTFIGISIFIIINPSIMTGVTLIDYHNDYCQSREAALTAKDPSNPLNLLCKNKYKKDKFIWLFIDGLAYDQLVKLPHQREKLNITNFFRIKLKEYKQSSSLHETMLTGKFSRNYIAKSTTIDHIFHQAKYSNKTLHYVGSEFPLFYLLGKEQSNIISHHIIKKPECFALDGFCPGGMNNIHNGFPLSIESNVTSLSKHLKDGISPNDLYDILMQNYSESNKQIPDKLTKCFIEDLFQSDKFDSSLIYYTMLIDHLNHSYDKKHITTLLNVFSTETGILGIIEWINRNPDYALIVSSDHGGQRYNGQDDICNHGCDELGNEAFLMIYTKELGMNQRQLYIDTRFISIDNVAPTVSQILSNVNIPLESQGIPYDLGNDPILRYTAVKSKEIQLRQFIEKYVMKYPNKGTIMLRFIERLKNNDYAMKVIDIKSIEQMDELFFMNYMNFLSETQLDINAIIAKDGHTLTCSICFYLTLGLLLLKIAIEIKQMHNIITIEIEQRTNKMLLGLIFFAFCFEVIVIFILSKMKLDTVFIYARLSEGIILFLVALFYLMLFGFDRKFFFSLCFVLFAIGSIVLVQYESFASFRYYLSQFSNRYYIDLYINYPIGIAYLIIESHALNRIYIDSKLRIKLTPILYGISAIIMGTMALFDKGNSEQFNSHTVPSKKYIRFIYALITLCAVCSFKKLWKKIPLNPNTKEPTQIKKVKCLILAKFPMFFYVFFISNETERLIILLLFLPVYYIFLNQIRKVSNMYWKLISFCYILMIPDILYIVAQNTFSFDISLKVSNKCIGNWGDDTPIMTGILIGTHKLKFFMLSAAYLLSVSKVAKMNFMKNDSFLIRMALDVQMMLIICLYCFVLWRGYEEHYLQIFIWIMTKCMIVIVFDIATLIWYMVNHGRSKQRFGDWDEIEEKAKTKDDYEDGRIKVSPADQVIEMEETQPMDE